MARGTYHFVHRPADIEHQHPYLVFDGQDRLHFHLTVFAKEAVSLLSEGTVRTYLYAVLPFFTFLDTDPWQQRAARRWDTSPDEVRQAVDDYLVQHLQCKVRPHRQGFQLISLTQGTRRTVHVFLAGLKCFYRVMKQRGYYSFANPLVDPVSALHTLIEEHEDQSSPPRMPACSGVEPPRYKMRLSDSYFKLEGEEWIPQVVDDLALPGRALAGGRLLNWGLREECVTRMLFESGGRISEVTGLTLGDWVARGMLQEANAFSKGNHGTRMKFLRFSNDTSKLLILPHSRLLNSLKVIPILISFAAWEDTLMSRKNPSHTWADLEGKIAPQVLHAPKTCGGPESNGARPAVHERIVGYLYYRMSGTPWTSHLALVAAVLTARHLDVGTIVKMLGVLHARFTELFPVLHLETMKDWDANAHMRAYLAGEVLPDTPDTIRAGFWKTYKAASMHVQSWLQSLPEDERSKFRPFVFPPVAPWMVEGLTKEDEISQRQRQHRKTETDAVVPRFSALRVESHYRFNKMVRLYQAYQQAVREVMPDHSNLPLDFSYDEGDPVQERLHFRLWDRRTLSKPESNAPVWLQ